MKMQVRAALALAVLAAAALRAEDAKTAQVAGKWEITREGRGGTMTSPVTFEQDGETLKGTVSGREGREFPLTGKVSGNKITFSYEMPAWGGREGGGREGGGREGGREGGGRGDGVGNGGPRKVEYTGTVDGDSISGEIETPRGKRPWTAKRAAASAAKTATEKK